jgi:Beta/Gamma crystallin
MGNFSGTGFNDGARSAVMHDGRWAICIDADFRGECRTFGPGEYASLPGMSDRISSGRMISSAYPYAGKSDWQRGGWNHRSQYQQGYAN